MVLILNACDNAPESEVNESPEDVAIAFFDAIYNQNDIDKALERCTEDLAQELRQYVSSKNVARRAFNLSYDSVEIDAALGDLKVRNDFRKSGKLTILFTGSRQNKIYKEMKNIRLVKRDNVWLVDEVLPDPSIY